MADNGGTGAGSAAGTQTGAGTGTQTGAGTGTQAPAVTTTTPGAQTQTRVETPVAGPVTAEQWAQMQARAKAMEETLAAQTKSLRLAALRAAMPDIIDPAFLQLVPETITTDPSGLDLTPQSRDALAAWRKDRAAWFKQQTGNGSNGGGGAPQLSHDGQVMSREYIAKIRQEKPETYRTKEFQSAMLAWLDRQRH